MNRLYPAVREAVPAQLPNWQRAAMLGAVRAQQTPGEQRQALANLALLGWELEPVLDDLVGGFRTARQLAAALGDIGYPLEALPAARAVLAQAGIIRSDQVVQDLTSTLEAEAGS